MPEQFKVLKPPRGAARLAFRLPIALYRLGLGGLLGKRFLMLTHTGRKSGNLRQTVLEVVRYDPECGAFYIASGWGAKADWYKNVMKDPHVVVHVGRQSFPAEARRLPLEQAEAELLDYHRRHPLALRELSRFIGYQLDGSEADIRALAGDVPILVLEPKTRPSRS